MFQISKENFGFDTIQFLIKKVLNHFVVYFIEELGEKKSIYAYLPIQKLEKIRPNKSSELNSPVISHKL